jgi:hypothetical protein
MMIIMRIDVNVRGASRLSRTSSGRVMAGMFKQDEQRVRAAERAPAVFAHSF